MRYDTRRFGPRLGALMRSRNETAKMVAAKTGIAYNTILAYKRGDRNPTMYGLARLCEHFQVSADWLLGIVPPR